MTQRVYTCIDLKSFYASVECAERGLDPMTTNLVVADASRTEKTICLAVSPSLKAYGIPGRPRLFEVVQKVREENIMRKSSVPGRLFTGESYDAAELAASPALSIAYITATPRMALYMEYSTRIYNIYLKYIAPEDIHVYSVDEVFIDLTAYLVTYRTTAAELTRRMIHEVYGTTGITATAGIGTNLYLSKIAMDIVAKHAEPDGNGVRMAELDEMSYRKQLWEHRPIRDFWRVGGGYARKLEENGMLTMGDVARCSMGKPGDYHNEELLYKLFGINAELLIDHAWGWEPCGMADIKAYRPDTNSISSGQVLTGPYPWDKTRLVVKEMAEHMALDLLDKGLVTDQLVLSIGYDIENVKDPEIRSKYKGEIVTDYYGRSVPKHAHGTANLVRASASARIIADAVLDLYDRITDRVLLARRLTLAANRVVSASSTKSAGSFEQLDMFTDYEEKKRTEEKEEAALERDMRIQRAMLDIKKKHGKNAILKGVSLKEGATAKERNEQIGGHKA